MHGCIFTTLSDLVIEQDGMAAWNRLLTEVNPASGGAYSNVCIYDDSEALDLIATLSRDKQLPQDELLKFFGRYLFPKLIDNTDADMSIYRDTKDMLFRVQDTIHRQITRLHPDLYTPLVQCEEVSDTRFLLTYRSHRKLCALCEGLAFGVADYFHESISIEHQKCMHNGDRRCEMMVTLEAACPHADKVSTEYE
jgi:hypothetical protein